MSSKEELRTQLTQFRTLVNEAREAGLTDAEIVDVLRLKPRGLGKQTREVLRAIQTGTIKPKADGSIRPVEVAEFLGKTRGTAIYHLNILKDAGYLK